MAEDEVSCIQGSTYLRSRPNLLAQYINAEFFVTHFVFFPAMQFVTSMGVFGGSKYFDGPPTRAPSGPPCCLRSSVLLSALCVASRRLGVETNLKLFRSTRGRVSSKVKRHRDRRHWPLR